MRARTARCSRDPCDIGAESGDVDRRERPPIGVYMKSKIAQWFKDKGEKEVTVKYIDPSYIVSSRLV